MYGRVAAWRTVHQEGSDHGYHELAGFADPIIAAQLLEEGLEDNGYVWIIPNAVQELGGTPGPTVLDGLTLVHGGDIRCGIVRVDNDVDPVDGDPVAVKENTAHAPDPSDTDTVSSADRRVDATTPIKERRR